MTAIYQGGGNWELKFNSRKRVILSEYEMNQIVEQFDAMIYRDCHDDIVQETEDERKFREAISKGSK